MSSKYVFSCASSRHLIGNQNVLRGFFSLDTVCGWNNVPCAFSPHHFSRTSIEDGWLRSALSFSRTCETVTSTSPWRSPASSGGSEVGDTVQSRN
jgi:hypothetical protein